MRFRDGVLSCAALLLVPLHGQAQGPSPLSDPARLAAVTAASADSSQASLQPSSPASQGRDTVLNGTVIGFAAGAALGLAYVHLTRDSDLDAGSYAHGALVIGGLGAAVGLGIDALLSRRPGVAGRSPRRLAVGPRLSRKSAGIGVNIRW